MIITSISILPNKMKIVQLKMREARFWPKMKFEPIFFQVLWQFFNPKGSLLRQRRTGAAGGRGVGGKEFLPALAFRFQFFSAAEFRASKTGAPLFIILSNLFVNEKTQFVFTSF
ncbi:MAG: hypothetical protein ABH837_02295 [bacterium]